MTDKKNPPAEVWIKYRWLGQGPLPPPGSYLLRERSTVTYQKNPHANPHASALGSIKSARKAQASRENGRRSAEPGKKGGRPSKESLRIEPNPLGGGSITAAKVGDTEARHLIVNGTLQDLHDGPVRIKKGDRIRVIPPKVKRVNLTPAKPAVE